jgi:hypothetical protein
MSFIESRVVLPEGASPIDHYARHYASRPDGKVVARYIIPDQPVGERGEDYGCEIATLNSGSRPCSSEELADSKRRAAQWIDLFGMADVSRWHEGNLMVPYVSDAGCAQIDIVFDPGTQRFESVKCTNLF